MGVEQNKATVQSAYAAFGEGNVDGVLATLADDVVWSAYTASDAPFSGQFKGHVEVARFFGMVVENIEIEKFEVDTILGESDFVVATLSERYKVKTTGKTHEGGLVHVYHFDAAGKVDRFDEYESANDAFRA